MAASYAWLPSGQAHQPERRDSIFALKHNLIPSLLQGYADSLGLDYELIASGEEGARITALAPVSYGELLPLSCNEDDAGRERNRRVEVRLRLPDSRATLR